MNVEKYLADIILTLSTSPDSRTAIHNLAGLGANGLADWCGIYMFENDKTIRRVAVAPKPETEALFPLDLHAAYGPAHVRRTGERQVLNLVGTEVAEGLGMKPGDLMFPDGRKPLFYACMPAVARNTSIGAVVFLSASSDRRFDEKELSLAASLTDAAAVAMDNSRLYREAQDANRLKDEFVAMVSHELRTPLTPMLGCIHLIRTTKLSPQNFERALEMIERNAQTQVQIVEDLLDASRIVAGKLHLMMKATSLIPIVEAAVGTVKSSAEAKSVKIVTDFADVQTPINGDPHRLQQIMWNLLSNAVKFTPPDGQVEICLRADNDQALIQVTDTGIGIPAEFLPHIFDRFRQGADGNSKMRSGLGLGLAIVRDLVELHNGSIQAASGGSGKGAVFTLRFPFASRQGATP